MRLSSYKRLAPVGLLLAAFVVASDARATLEDVCSGKTPFVKDSAGSNDFGANFNMHAFHAWWNPSGVLNVYFSDGSLHDAHSTVSSLATSSDLRSFSRVGVVADTGGQPTSTWGITSGSYRHNVGSQNGSEWVASTVTDSIGYMAFGPYYVFPSTGSRWVTFNAAVDNNDADNSIVMTLDVRKNVGGEGTSGSSISSRDVRRKDFSGADSVHPHTFGLPFDVDSLAPSSYEFRVKWNDTAFVRLYDVGVGTTNSQVDEDWASFPDVWKDGSTYYLVYECAGGPGGSYINGICLATSTDGTTFTKSPSNPILVGRNANGSWEGPAVGTPSLYKVGSTWYLYYHSETRTSPWHVQIGVASGSSLTSLTQASATQPRIPNGGPGSWDAGTVGFRSRIIPENGKYYMAYEGSTEAIDPADHFKYSVFSTGLAYTTDLLGTWNKCPANPIIDRTTPDPNNETEGFGNDNPELVFDNSAGKTYLFVRRPTTSGRAKTVVDRYSTIAGFPNPPCGSVSGGSPATLEVAFALLVQLLIRRRRMKI